MDFVVAWIGNHFGAQAGNLAEDLADEAKARAIAVDWHKVMSDVVTGLLAGKHITSILLTVAGDLDIELTP